MDRDGEREEGGWMSREKEVLTGIKWKGKMDRKREGRIMY